MGCKPTTSKKQQMKKEQENPSPAPTKVPEEKAPNFAPYKRDIQSERNANKSNRDRSYTNFLENVPDSQQKPISPVKYNSAEAFDSVPEAVNPAEYDNSLLGNMLCPNVLKEYSKLDYIARPLTEPFELVILDIQKRNINLNSSFDHPILNSYNLFSSYCNGLNKLFLSGGEMKSFVTIDLATCVIESLPLVENRKSHSMIVLPYEFSFDCGGMKMKIPCGFVFLVGGGGTKTVEYYDLKNKNLIHHSHLNEIHIEPALALLDNSYLYAFSGFKRPSGKKECFERINLKSRQDKWESFSVKLNANSKFGQTCFAVAHYGENQLIFLGGCDTHKNSLHSDENFLFNWKDDTLAVSDLPFVSEEYTEKFLFPVREEDQKKQTYTSIGIPNKQRNQIFISLFMARSLKSVTFEMEA